MASNKVPTEYTHTEFTCLWLLRYLCKVAITAFHTWFFTEKYICGFSTVITSILQFTSFVIVFITRFLLCADSNNYPPMQVQEYVTLNLKNNNMNISSAHFHSPLLFQWLWANRATFPEFSVYRVALPELIANRVTLLPEWTACSIA